jgi:hypothetical protein
LGLGQREIKKLKKMKVKKLLCLLAILMPMLSANCYAQIEKMHSLLENSTCQDFKIKRAPKFQFQNLKGLNINIEPRTPAQYYSHVVQLSGSSCFIMPTVNYIKAMGFSDIGENEYTLTIYLNEILANLDAGDFNYISRVYVTFKIKLINKSGQSIFEQVVTTDMPSTLNIAGCFGVLNEAYTQSLEKINWYKISSFLKKSSEPKQEVKQESSEPKQLAKEEPRKQVEGYGNTDLENTIVRWEVQSRPAGADVFWRVVSKTPSVKSTNNKYLQTTPYEATKSLDIRGLSYENSGDVRIILRCEKEGYYPQEKEFNVRMIIDQEEISAFFRLVKEE